MNPVQQTSMMDAGTSADPNFMKEKGGEVKEESGRTENDCRQTGKERSDTCDTNASGFLEDERESNERTSFPPCRNHHTNDEDAGNDPNALDDTDTYNILKSSSNPFQEDNDTVNVKLSFQKLSKQVEELDQQYKDLLFQQMQKEERWQDCGWSITTASVITNSIALSDPNQNHQNNNNGTCNVNPSVSIQMDDLTQMNKTPVEESNEVNDLIHDEYCSNNSDDDDEVQVLAQITRVYPNLLSDLQGQLNPKVWLYQASLLGDNSQEGTNVTFDSEEWWKKLHHALETEATISGNAIVQNAVGEMHRRGLGVPINAELAFRWLQLAAQQGHAKAQCNVGVMYAIRRGVLQDDNKAAEYFQLAANQGHLQAYCALGVLHHFGRGVPHDHTKALQYYQLAANQAVPGAQYNLGIMYHNGDGVSQDHARAVEHYQLAAIQGDARGQFNLGAMYDMGQGVLQDDTQAVDFYQLAANQGHPKAQYNLGIMYDVGRGVAQDHTKARDCYQLAANQGLVEAQELVELL